MKKKKEPKPKAKARITVRELYQVLLKNGYKGKPHYNHSNSYCCAEGLWDFRDDFKGTADTRVWNDWMLNFLELDRKKVFECYYKGKGDMFTDIGLLQEAQERYLNGELKRAVDFILRHP